VQYRTADANANDQTVKPHFRLINTGTNPVALSTLTIRYWYTIDTPVDVEAAVCDFVSAPVGCNNVLLSNVTLSPPRPGADHYFQVGFTSGAGSLASGAVLSDIQVWFHKNLWGNYTETNDHSFDPTKTAYADWGRVTLYQNGMLVWGIEPEGTCRIDAECPSNHFCVDGVCCSTACGGGDPNDCQACSVAAGAPSDGTCALLGPSRVCRPPVNACDEPTTCTAMDAACPAPTPPLCVSEVQGTVSWNGSPVSGTAAAGLTVTGRPNVNTSPWTVNVSTSGLYRSGNIMPQPIVYHLSLTGGSCDSAGGNDFLAGTDVSISAGTIMTANLDMTASAGLVTGTITRGGQPTQATILINGGDCTTLVTDANGQVAQFFAPGTYLATPSVSGSTLPAFSFSVQPGQTTDVSLAIAAGPGAPCPNGNECDGALLCVDGVCCTSACAGGPDDCQACSVAAGGTTDGTCTALTTAPVCRRKAGACDVEERCLPTSQECPANSFATAGTTCGTSSGDVCDVAGTCDSSGTCGPNTYSPGTLCYDRRTDLCASVEAQLTCVDNSSTCPTPTRWPVGGCGPVAAGAQTVNLLGGQSSVGGVTITVLAPSSPGGQLAAQGPGQFSPEDDPNRCPPATGFAVVQGGDDQTGQFWNIDASAGWIATPAQVCVHYSPNPNWVAEGFDECGLKLFHGATVPATGACTPNDAAWTSINIGGVTAVCPSSGRRCTATGAPGAACQANTICGMVSDHFSPFAVFAPLPASTPTVTVPANMVAAATSTAGATVSFAASAVDPIDGPLTPECAPASGSEFPIGTTAVTCTATNSLGISDSAVFTVWVQYQTPTDGSFFLFPIKSNGSSVFRIGRPVPARFRLEGASKNITNLVARFSVTKISNAVQGTAEDTSDETVDDTDFVFKYRPLLKWYVYRWKTSDQTQGTYRLRADLGDGVTHEVNVSLRRPR
jgi:hypothetical protein